MSIVATETISGFFHGVVEDAMRARRVQANEVVTQYLVALLADYARPRGRAGQALDEPLAFLLDDALRTRDFAERFERLQSLGDGVLYVSGFFGSHFEARGVEQNYLVGIGTAAYGSASAMLRSPEKGPGETSDILGELADKFRQYLAVIGDVADATISMGAVSSKNVLKIYERWRKTGSEVLAHALSSHGLLPMKGSPGVLQ